MFDTIVYNGTILTMDQRFSTITKGAMAVHQGEIKQVWEYSGKSVLPEAKEHIDAQGGIIMPGLVNGHTHLPMTLFRGLADDLPLSQWLNDHIFPAEAQHVNPKSVVLGARLACAEMLLGGITTCCDGYFLVAHFIEEVANTGIRAILGQGVIDYPAPGVPDPALNVTVARNFAEKWRSLSGRVQPSIFCHSPYTCSAQTLTAAKKAATDLGAVFQIHVAETEAERDQMLARQGSTPVQYLDRLGILDPQTLLIHAVWLDARDIDIVARSKARVIHCPQSNMKLASGVAPVPDMLAAGICVGLGTDGSASNNDLDLWAEMDSAAKLHKVHRLDPTLMAADTVLHMATIQGARALGLDHQIGSLEPGKRADFIVLNMDQPHLIPMYHPSSHLVYAAGPADVRHVMIDGQWVVQNGQLQILDMAKLREEINAFITGSIGRR
ncbi:MAG: amidohydrolase [Desulfobacteraceae bacterium]|nr:amidohydrolase [Desulfobacteraceae bacterium]